MVCSRFASSEPGILLLPTAYSSTRRLQWMSYYDTLYGLLRNHLDGFVDIPEKVGRVQIFAAFPPGSNRSMRKDALKSE